MADDLDLQPPGTNNRLLLLNAGGWRVVLTAGFSPGLRLRVPLAQNAAGPSRGVLIAPRATGYQPRWLDEWIAGGAGVWFAQGDLAGAGVLAFAERESLLEQNPPPGRAVLISDGRARAAQLALDPAAHGDGRSP